MTDQANSSLPKGIETKLQAELGRVVFGSEEVIHALTIALLGQGHILLEGAPEWLDLAEMQSKIIAAVPQVTEIHHVHVWGLTPQHPMLTMHVVLVEKPEDPTALVRSVKQVLKSNFGINHSTIEVELGDCADH